MHRNRERLLSLKEVDNIDALQGSMSNRSELMSRIRGKNTKPERLLRSALWERGLRYRLHQRVAGARPDLVFPGPSVAVFVDGCFWHGCPEHYVYPRTRRDFWSEKLATNVERDRKQTRLLEQRGWTVVRLWEHEVMADLRRSADRVETAVRGDSLPARESWRVVEVAVVDEEEDTERRQLETLREPILRKSMTQVRSTKKWNR